MAFTVAIAAGCQTAEPGLHSQVLALIRLRPDACAHRIMKLWWSACTDTRRPRRTHACKLAPVQVQRGLCRAYAATVSDIEAVALPSARVEACNALRATSVTHRNTKLGVSAMAPMSRSMICCQVHTSLSCSLIKPGARRTYSSQGGSISTTSNLQHSNTAQRSVKQADRKREGVDQLDTKPGTQHSRTPRIVSAHDTWM